MFIYVKKAYLQAKFDPALIVRVGAADLPWVPFDEGVYGFRFVENTLQTDRTKFGTSSDWGVHVLGSFANNLVSYQVSAIDGQGYKTLARSSDTLDLEGRVSVNPLKVITLAVGGYTGKLGKSAGNLPDSATPHTASRFDALAAYTDKRIRAGIEYFAATNWNSMSNTAVHDKSDGWSAFGSFAFTPASSVASDATTGRSRARMSLPRSKTIISTWASTISRSHLSISPWSTSAIVPTMA